MPGAASPSFLDAAELPPERQLPDSEIMQKILSVHTTDQLKNWNKFFDLERFESELGLRKKFKKSKHANTYTRTQKRQKEKYVIRSRSEEKICSFHHI